MQDSTTPDVVPSSNNGTSNSTSMVKHVKIVDLDKNTKLHYAAAAGLLEELTVELQKTVKIDVENYLGWTPLMMACRRGQLEVVKLLLEHRCDATRKNKFGYSVFLITVATGNLELISLILRHLLSGGVSRQSMEKIFSPVSLAILYTDKNVMEYLLENSFNVNAATTTGLTPLMFAVAMGRLDMYKLLKSKKADASLKNHLGASVKDIHANRSDKPVANLSENISQMPSAKHPMPVPPAVPMILISPQPNYISLTPNPFVQLPHQYSRKSSNVVSPNFYFTPNVTPMPLVSQMFFPQDFSPSHVISPGIQHIYNTPDVFNNRFNQGHYSFLSPMGGGHNMYSSPCV